MTDRYEKNLKVLAECRDIAMEWTLRGRIPECGKFGEIAQDLDAVCAELAFLASAPVKVPEGYVLIAEDCLEVMIGPERMDHLRRSCRFPVPERTPNTQPAEPVKDRTEAES